MKLTTITHVSVDGVTFGVEHSGDAAAPLPLLLDAVRAQRRAGARADRARRMPRRGGRGGGVAGAARERLLLQVKCGSNRAAERGAFLDGALGVEFGGAAGATDDVHGAARQRESFGERAVGILASAHHQGVEGDAAVLALDGDVQAVAVDRCDRQRRRAAATPKSRSSWRRIQPVLLPSVRPKGPGERLMSVTWRRGGEGLGVPETPQRCAKRVGLGGLAQVGMGEVRAPRRGRCRRRR